MDDPLEKVHEKYEEIPRDVFLSKIPFVICHAPDHRIVPAYGLNIISESGNRTKWVKVASVEDFVKACRSYWKEASGVVYLDTLCVYIMPYMPLHEAFIMHKKIVNAEILPVNFAEAVELMGAQVMDEAVDFEPPKLGLEQEEKIGVIEFEDLDVNLEFVVVNYEILWHKAKSYCMLKDLSVHLHEFINMIANCDKILGALADKTDLMITTVEEARRCLIFSLFQTGTQAAVHDGILLMYPAVHASVYQDCQRCDQQIQLVDIEDPAGTMERLNLALIFLGFQENHFYPPVEDAQHNLMVAEGHSEFHDYNLNIQQDFANARNDFRNSLVPIIDNITLAGQCFTLMGVGGDPQGR